MDTTIKTAGIPFRFTVRTLVIGATVYVMTAAATRPRPCRT